MATMKILLDTNFMMDIFRYRIDISQILEFFPNSELITIPQVVKELEKIASSKSTHGRYAKIALETIKNKDDDNKKNSVRIMDKGYEEFADDVLVKMANEENVVATNDEKLRKRMKKIGLKTIYLRGRKQLAVA